MKKTVLYTFCFVMIISCKKENIITKQTESSNQLLTKVIKTTNLSSDVSYNETINYEYNNAGKIIAAGNKTYFRDNKQRIVRILDPGTGTNRDDIQVYYNSQESNKVSYTLCSLVGGGATDSVVYVHDSNERLIKTISYFSYISGSYSPNATFLSHYDIFTYDENGNIAQLDSYNVTNGVVAHCARYGFNDYDKMINPQYAVDEVRSMEFSYEGVINSSINNCRSIGRYSKSYEYRTDGRPRSCIVTQNGIYSFKLTFEYQ